MERFARAISGLGKIGQDVLDAVIVEFLELLTTGPEIAGGARRRASCSPRCWTRTRSPGCSTAAGAATSAASGSG